MDIKSLLDCVAVRRSAAFLLHGTSMRPHHRHFCLAVTKMGPEVRSIITNSEMLALNQDPLGHRGEIVYVQEGRVLQGKEEMDQLFKHRAAL